MSVDTSQLRADVTSWLDDSVAMATDDWLAQIDGVAPVKTGETVASGRVTIFTGAPYYIAELAYPTPQALWTDEGTRAHEIVGNPLLAFDWNGQLVITHSVQHPGFVGTRWFSDSVTDPAWAGELDRALEAQSR